MTFNVDIDRALQHPQQGRQWQIEVEGLMCLDLEDLLLRVEGLMIRQHTVPLVWFTDRQCSVCTGLGTFLAPTLRQALARAIIEHAKENR